MFNARKAYEWNWNIWNLWYDDRELSCKKKNVWNILIFIKRKNNDKQVVSQLIRNRQWSEWTNIIEKAWGFIQLEKEVKNSIFFLQLSLKFVMGEQYTRDDQYWKLRIFTQFIFMLYRESRYIFLKGSLWYVIWIFEHDILLFNFSLQDQSLNTTIDQLSNLIRVKITSHAIHTSLKVAHILTSSRVVFYCNKFT